MPFISPVAHTETSAFGSSHGIRKISKVHVFVEDNGIGVAVEHQKKIFGIFERVPGSRGYEGTGIGLAIVARAVQRMHGSYGVESKPGGGSRFWIQLPGVSMC